MNETAWPEMRDQSNWQQGQLMNIRVWDHLQDAMKVGEDEK